MLGAPSAKQSLSDFGVPGNALPDQTRGVPSQPVLERQSQLWALVSFLLFIRFLYFSSLFFVLYPMKNFLPSPHFPGLGPWGTEMACFMKC